MNKIKIKNQISITNLKIINLSTILNHYRDRVGEKEVDHKYHRIFTITQCTIA